MHIPVISTAIKSWQFSSIANANESKSGKMKQQLKSVMLTSINARLATKWFNIIQSPEFSSINSYRPGLFLKPFRVYMSIKWNKKKKIKVIQDSYRFMLAKGHSFIKVLEESDVEIARFKMNDTTEGYLHLGYDGRYRKEGELVVSFSTNQTEGKIVAASFSFEEIAKDKWVCWIGCVQGHEKNEEYSSKKAQKLLFGMRPKALAIFTVQEFVRHLGFSNVYGAGDSIQAYRQKHAIHIHWKHAIKFNYNEFWTESGGKPAAEGWYELPLVPFRRSIQDIKSEKRSYYNKRYRILDELSLEISDSVKKNFLGLPVPERKQAEVTTP